MRKYILGDKEFRRIFGILVIVAILANLKSILNDYNIDSGYAVVMSYRQAMGEVLLSEMREPHQTSAFLSALLIKIYLMVMGTTKGIVLYLQAAGVIIRGFFCFFFFQTMKPLIRKDMLMLMCLFFFSVAPKGLPLPEFSNMQVWFAVGLICALVRYFQDRSECWLISAGVFLCLEILSYPSCLIVYAGVVWLIARYAQKKWRDIGIFTGTCLCGGGIYCGWLLSSVGYDDMRKNITDIVSGDGSHSMSMMDKFMSYMWEGVGILAFFLVIGILAYVLLKAADAIWELGKRGKRKLCTRQEWVTLFFFLLFACELVVIFTADLDYCVQVPMYIPIILAGIFLYKYCSEIEQRIFVVGTVISVLDFGATLMLTNLTVKSSLSYMIPAVMVAVIPIIRGIEKTVTAGKRYIQYGLLFVFCALIIFRSGYLFSSMAGTKGNLFSLGGIVKDGPAVGIVSEYMGPYIFESTMQEWESLLSGGESVLIVSGAAYDPLMYLFDDVEISVPSTICTPTYDEKLLEYWEKYPEKYPDVIIVECWYGDLRVKEESWIMQWISTKYPNCRYVDGKYWRYYFLQE